MSMWLLPHAYHIRCVTYALPHVYVVRQRGRLAPRQPLSVCTLLPAPREEQASTASWKPRPPFEAAEMD